MTTVAPDPDGPRDEPRIRPAERADLLAVFHIEQSAFPQPWPFSAFEQFLDEPGFLVAQCRDGSDSARETETVGDDGSVVGYVVADAVPNHDEAIGHVKDIAVAEPCRGQGVGRRLLARSLDALRAQGVGRVKLEVRETNDAAKALYRDFGFVHRKTLPRYYSNGEDALVMFADLDSRN